MDDQPGDPSTFGVTIFIDANTLAFGGSVEPPAYGLHDLVSALPPEAASFLGWVPNIMVDAAGVMFDPATDAFGVYATAGLADSGTPSAQLFIGDVPVGESTAFVVGVTLSSRIELSGTPLFGSMLSGISLSGLTFTYASADIPTGAIALPPPAPANQPAYPAGPVLSFTLSDGTAEQHFTLTPAGAKQPPDPPSLLVAGSLGDDPPPPVAPIQWFNVQKSIGPLTIGRIGIVSGSDELGLALDASVQTTALGVDLTGFTLFFKPTSDISLSGLHVSLDGLAVNFSSGSVTIAGSLVRTVVTVDDEPLTEYDGAILIQAGVYGIAAVGSFAELHGSPSLFIFGMAKGKFGGPPAFFVTGIAAGFGYNRSLRLPTPDQVQQFPFVLMATEGSSYLPDPGAAAALGKLTQGGWVPPELGSYWVAAGISFTSFELLDAFALLTVQFGNETVIALLGVAAIALPAAGEPYAYAEMTLDAVLRPAEGTFAMTALLTPNSFVLYRDCRLTGGFAFYLWFGDNPHSGDFVVTLGGYNSAFAKPDWYPAIPRLGFSWNVSSEVHIAGGAYFAVTPSCVMGGGSLSLTFQSGDLKAWFDAHADFIMWWKPFYFDISIGVSIGASYTLDLLFTSKTLTVELSADVELWGPPLAGVAHVSWYIISFSIDINGGGSPSLPGRSLDWSTFQTSFLPGSATPPALRGRAARGSAPAAVADTGPSPVCRPRATSGLSGTWENGEESVWLVSADSFAITTETVVPATSVVVDGPTTSTTLAFTGPAVGVYPMGNVLLTSAHHLGLRRVVDTVAVDRPEDLSAWTWAPVTGDLPYSLWGTQNNGDPALSAATVPGLVGLAGTPSAPVLTGPPEFQLEALRFVRLEPELLLPISTGPPVDGSTTPPGEDSRQVIADTVAEASVVGRRGRIAALLNRSGVGVGLDGGELALLAAEVFVTLQSAPMLGPVGSTGPRVPSDPTVEPAPEPAPGASPEPGGTRRPGRPAVGPRPATGPVPVALFRSGPLPASRTGSHPASDAASPLAAALPVRRTTCHVFDAHASRTERAVAAALTMAAAAGGRIAVAAGTTSVWRVDPGRVHTVHSDGGAPVRALAFDAQYLLLDEAVLDAHRSSHVFAAGTERVVLVGTARVAPGAPLGWHHGSRLLQLSPQALLVDGVVVRPQGPRRVRLRRSSREAGVVSAASLVAGNWVETTAGRRAGWVDTWLPADVRSVALTVRPSDAGHRLDASAATGAVDLLVAPAAAGGVPFLANAPRPGWADIDTAGGTVRLLADLPRLAGTRRVRVATAEGWTLSGVCGLAGNAVALRDGLAAGAWGDRGVVRRDGERPQRATVSLS